ncbi:MAG TPA: hypothetical protein VG796_04035 [Verrucomicrobiales bacterium]|nr:hypothetical protein [Verrucomicrobiales bacterium]
MKPAQGLFITLCLFAASAGLASLTSLPQANAKRPQIPITPSAQAVPSTSSPDAMLSKLERKLLGGNAPDAGPYSAAAFEQLSNNAWRKVAGDHEIREFAERWIKHDPAAVLAWIQNAPYSRTERACLLFEAWAKVDIDAALSAALRLTGDISRPQALIRVLQILARTDPGRARTLYEQNTALFAENQSLTLSLADGETAGKDFDFLQSLPPGKSRGKLLAAFLEARVSSALPKAVAFWNAAPLEVRKDIIAGGFLDRREIRPPYDAGQEAESFPGAVDLLREHAESTGRRGDLRSFYYRQALPWALRDFPAAIEWTQKHVGGKEGMEFCADLFESVALHDYDTVVRTWRSLPAGIYKAEVAGAIARSSRAEDEKKTAESLIRSLPPRYQETARKRADR